MERGVEDVQLLVGELDRVHGASLLFRNGYEPVTRRFPKPSRVGLMKTFLAITGTLAVALMLAGCGSHKSSSKASAPPAPTGSNYPYTNPIKAEGSSPPRLAGDGRYFGYIRA